jgi:hypothetical protein
MKKGNHSENINVRMRESTRMKAEREHTATKPVGANTKAITVKL